MTGFEETIRFLLTEIAHHPQQLYFWVILILTASSFGLPLPEEVVLLTCGSVAYIAVQESLATGQPPTVEPILLSIICFVAVLGSDLLVFSLGHRYGLKLLKSRPLNKLITEATLEHVKNGVKKYGAWACALFRFTPGVRFPGHFMCGAMGISYTKFLMTDGVAALLTVPTQVLFLAYYGDDILIYFKKFKIALLVVLASLFVVWFFKRRKSVETNNVAIRE